MVPPPRGCGWQTTAAATAELASRRIPSSRPCATGISTRPDGDGGIGIAANVSLQDRAPQNDGHTGLGQPPHAIAPSTPPRFPSPPTAPSPVCPKLQVACCYRTQII